MIIEPLEDADFTLVELKETPHCKIHGAMNKFTRDGIWRCFSVNGYEAVEVKQSNGSIAKGKQWTDTLCRAGCVEKYSLLDHQTGDKYTMEGSTKEWKIVYYPILENNKNKEIYEEPRALVESPEIFTGKEGIDFREVPLRYLTKITNGRENKTSDA